MISKISKFLVIFVCVFCIAFCDVSAKQPQQEQSFNTIIREVLVNVPNAEIPQQFQSVAFKTITKNEVFKYDRHEFLGVRALRDIFGDKKQKFETTYIYLSNNKPIVANASATWYVMKQHKSDKLRFRLYYQKTPVAETMSEGDVLFIGKTKYEGKLFIIIANSKSPIKDKLLASFNSEESAIKPVKYTKKESINELITSLPVQPTENWVQVFFTPSLDCENNIISRLNNAKQIDIAVYSITNRNIVNAILAAHKRGAKVRVMTDKVQSKGENSLVKELIDAGIPVRTNSYKKDNAGHRIEHNKFAIFDGKEIENGSYNWTKSATNCNSENCMFLKQKQTVDKFSDRYEYLWKLYGNNISAD